ncbi:MAG: NYN domain-containing protein [Planctomycetota bacterium]
MFIDGAYLTKVREEVARDVLRVPEIPLEPKTLTGADRVLYYDCLPGREKEGPEADYLERTRAPRAWLERMALQDKVHVVEGVVAGAGRRARQKQVDVQIAVDALMHAFRRNLGSATLLTGDQDFVPLALALVALGVEVKVWCHRRSASRDLLRVADVRLDLTSHQLVSMAPHAWRESIAFPRIWQQQGPYEGDVRQRGCGPDGQDVFFLKTDKGFTIVHPDPLNWGGWMHAESTDEALLRRVHEDVYFHTRWASA